MTPQLLEQIVGRDVPHAIEVAAFLSIAMDRYELTTPLRVAHFIAQAAHESAGFRTALEGMNYSAAGLVLTWPDRFYMPPDEPRARANADEYHRKPEKIANFVYANRNGNGDIASGDGWRYRGRGFLQITGRATYAAFNEAEPTFMCVTYPEMLERIEIAALSAAWVWRAKGCNALADAGLAAAPAITRKINGGTTGLEQRLALTKRAIWLLVPGRKP